MNYITHLSRFYQKFDTDDRFTPHHISLYSGIFQLWNAARFKNPFHVNRSELMHLSRIGSVNTYIRCLKELDEWKYIEYFPSRNITVGSQISVITFDNTTAKSAETRLRHSNKPVKTNTNIPSQQEVDLYFKEENYPEHEAAIFYSHYTANGWMMGSAPVKNWQSAAINWMAKAGHFSSNKTQKSSSAQRSTSITESTNTNSTNYHEPL